MGGIIAQSLAVSHPGLIDKLLLVSTAYFLEPLKERIREFGKDKESVYNSMKNYFSDSFLATHKNLISAIIIQIVNNQQDPEYRRGIAAQVKALKNIQERNIAVELIKSQTMILHGSNDKIVDFDDARKLHEKIPNSKLLSAKKTVDTFCS